MYQSLLKVLTAVCTVLLLISIDVVILFVPVRWWLKVVVQYKLLYYNEVINHIFVCWLQQFKSNTCTLGINF